MLFHLLMHPLQKTECRMTLIDMPYGRFDPDCAQTADAADTQADFLFDAILQSTTVELISNLSIFLVVGGDVRIKEQHLDVSDIDPPKLEIQVSPWKLNLNENGIPPLVQCGLDAQILETRFQIAGNLLTLGIDVLREIPMPVEKP
jgi:hypothetical protein